MSHCIVGVDFHPEQNLGSINIFNFWVIPLIKFFTYLHLGFGTEKPANWLKISGIARRITSEIKNTKQKKYTDMSRKLAARYVIMYYLWRWCLLDNKFGNRSARLVLHCGRYHDLSRSDKSNQKLFSFLFFSFRFVVSTIFGM